MCNRCRNEYTKARDPQRHAYYRLKSNAKRRGKPFDLTLADFREFCEGTDYIKGKGRTARCYHVDRIDETKGYTRDNLQCITNSDNRAKYVSFAYGHGDPSDPDTNERGMWYRTTIGRTDAPETHAPF